MNIQPFRRLLTSFDSKKQNSIRVKQDEQLTFMEGVLYMNSIVLIKKAREKGFLTWENMEDAVQFAITHKKEKILPYLLEWSVEKDAYRGEERYTL